MAEINCPICNRLNKDEAERCWYCQAVLHPEKKNADGSSDWLDGFRQENTETPFEESNEASAGSDESPEDVPDWLARIRQREQLEHGGEPEQNPDGEKDTLDWLRSAVGNESPTESNTFKPAEVNEPAPTESDNDADWLGKLQSWQEESSEPNKSPAPEHPFEQEPKPSFSGPSNQEPDWLNEFKSEAAQSEPLPPEKQPDDSSTGDKPSPENISAFEQEPKAPIAEEPIIKDSIPPTDAIGFSIPEGNVVKPSSPEPDWLTDFQSLDETKDLAGQVMPKPAVEEPVKAPFSGRDIMDWIDKDRSTPEEKPENAVEQVEVPQGTDEGIEPAKLPSWLQALRPDKSKRGIAGSTTSSDLNQKSPLAGIEGVLQDSVIGQFYTRPQTYANTLKITPEQENHLQRLQNIAGEARWEAQESVESKRQSSILLKAVVSLLLIGVIVFTVLTQKNSLVEPTMYSQPVVETFNIISALDPAKPVLIAAEFDSGLYGELKWSSESLLQQLMARNIPIAYLSTTQAGSTLFQATITDLARKNQDYSLADHTLNLGYLTGGTVGLQALADDPRGTLPLTTLMKPAWTGTPLQNTEKISDFGAVIVITENADTARYWIEQVKPSMGKTPLLVVISAQSAPMLQPYYDSGQVNGYIAGESGGTAFEKMAGVEGSSTSHFSAYQSTLILLVVLIFVGGMISLVLSTPSPERSDKNQS
jgi:hypothetical protein